MMKKMRFLICGAIACLLLLTAFSVSAAPSTAYTYTVSVNGDWIRTQDAYIPSRIYLKEQELVNPQDLFVAGNLIYVADTDNQRIVILDRETSSVSFFEYDEFMSPSGIFARDNGELYIADPVAQAVFVFNADRTLKVKIERPDSVLFGSQSLYQPKKVAVSSQGNIFAVGEGAFEGIMQFDQSGTFQGYFAANKKNLTALERLQEIILNEDQLDQLMIKAPRSIQNIDITDRDLIFSVTQSGEGSTSNHIEAEKKTANALKLHNMAGTNILSVNTFMRDEWNFIDVAAGAYGNSFAVTYTGLIYEYDPEGNLLFSFGGRALDSDAFGLMSLVSAIDADENGILYVLDSERGLIQCFIPTRFSSLTHQAIYQMNSGNYSGAEETWQSILKLNGMSKIAHIGYGRTLFRQQKYGAALEQFKLAKERSDYSQCFWELRDAWLSGHMPWLIIGLLLLAVGVFYLNKFKRKKVESGSDLLTDDPRGRARIWRDIKFSMFMFRHPVDGYYYLKRGIRGSALSASVLYGGLFIVFLCDNLFKAFIYNTSSLADAPLTIVWFFLAAVLLWNLGNYMVSSINNGEGSFKNIYVMTAYALTPYMVITLIKVILSYALSQNESFVLALLSIAAIAWSAVLIVIGLIQTHNYSFGETAKNCLLTLFAMIIAIVAIAIIYLIWSQLLVFLKDVILEVLYAA